MRSVIHYILALSLTLAPTASFATSPDQQSDSTDHGREMTLNDLGAKAGEPGYVVDVNHLTLGPDKVTIETRVAIAEDPQAEKIAAEWFQNQIASAEKEKAPFTISHTVVEGEKDPIDEGRVQLSAIQKSKLRITHLSQVGYQKLIENAKAVYRPVDKARSSVTAPVQRFLMKSEQRYRVTFAMSRLIINSTVMSYTFASDFFLGGTVPLSVALTAGLSGGVLSGLFNYFSHVYSGWLDTPGKVFRLGDKVLNILKTLFPKVEESLLNEIVKAAKWMALEGAFFMVPVGILAAFGYPIAASLGVFAAKLLGTVVGGTMSQFPWDSAITRFQNVGNQLNANNPDEKNLINFKSSLAFVAVSVLSVAVSTASLGSEWWKSYTLLGAMGLLGHRIKKKIYAKMDEKLVQSIASDSVVNTECQKLFTDRKAI